MVRDVGGACREVKKGQENVMYGRDGYVTSHVALFADQLHPSSLLDPFVPIHHLVLPLPNLAVCSTCDPIHSIQGASVPTGWLF